jgi:hypothetical protein
MLASALWVEISSLKGNRRRVLYIKSLQVHGSSGSWQTLFKETLNRKGK